MRDDELVAVLRFTDHADPMLCICGANWGFHGLDCSGAPSLAQPCDEFRYDFSNSKNALKKLRCGYSVHPTRVVFPDSSSQGV